MELSSHVSGWEQCNWYKLWLHLIGNKHEGVLCGSSNMGKGNQWKQVGWLCLLFTLVSRLIVYILFCNAGANTTFLSLVCVAVTEYLRLGNLQWTEIHFLTITEAGESKTKATAFGEGPIAVSFNDRRQTGWEGRQGTDKRGQTYPFMTTLIPPMRSESSWPNHPQTFHLLILSHWQPNFSTSFGGAKHSNHSTLQTALPFPLIADVLLGSANGSP